eukprot:gene23916-31038_t
MSIHRIFAARETAIVEKSKFESKLVEYTELLKLSNNEFMNSILHPTSVKIWETVCPISLRGVPLGYDRYGSSYYLLQAQESMTLKPLGSYSIDQQLDDNNDISIDPAILIKDPTGWWGYHTEKTLKKFESIKNDLKNDEAQLSIKANQIDKVDETIENVDTIEDKRVDSKVDDSVVNKVEYIE